MKVAVIGAGPAGMSCANALLSFGLEPIVIERADHVGGIQRANFHPNLWMLGMPGETGIQITERLAKHYFELPVVTRLKADIQSVAKVADSFRIKLTDTEGEHTLTVSALVLCTGSKPRSTPDLDAFAARSERVIIGPLSDTIRDGIRNSRVLILGGGDNAFDHALYLAERGNRVTVCARGEFSARRQFQSACAARAEIELRRNCTPDALALSDKGISVSRDVQAEHYDWLLTMFGYVPRTDLLERFDPTIRPRIAASGHIHVEHGQRTSVPGIYAAGDVTDSIQPSVPTAIAHGLTAAKAVELDQVTFST